MFAEHLISDVTLIKILICALAIPFLVVISHNAFKKIEEGITWIGLSIWPYPENLLDELLQQKRKRIIRMAAKRAIDLQEARGKKGEPQITIHDIIAAWDSDVPAPKVSWIHGEDTRIFLKYHQNEL